MRKLSIWFTLAAAVACENAKDTVYVPYVPDTVTEGDGSGPVGGDASGCTDGCSVGAHRCNGDGIVETCVDPDNDGCGAWGDPTPCATGQACQAGQCALSCTDECEVQGARQCDGASVVTCRDHDSDGCLEWGGAAECVGGTVCQSGFCSVACAGTPECNVQGAKKCDGDGVAACADLDFDGCLSWTDPTPCPAGQACSNGGCATDCTDECTVVGARRCGSSGGYQTCGNADADDCLEWGPETACGAGESCSNGFCDKSCKDECTVVGAAQCSGNAVQTCGNTDADACLEWGTAVPCGSGLVCSNGYCSVSCSDECSVSGVRICDVGGVKTCGDANDDGCLEWGTVVPCEAGQTCSNGQCATDCTDECTVQGARRCLGAAVQVCGNADGDSCLEWGTATGCGVGEACSNGFCSTDCTDECDAVGQATCDGDAVRTCESGVSGCLAFGAPEACAAGLTCSSGKCANTCTDECTVQGAKKCVGSGVSTCGNTDADPCLEWGSAVPCGNGQACSSGFCSTSCTDECTVKGAKACDAAGVITCDDKDNNGCLEWSAGVACTSGTTCSNGICSSTCTDECGPAGGRRCQGNTVQTCGNFDADSCLEWGTGAACAVGQTCSGGACTLGCTNECTVKGARQCAAAATYQICDDKNGDGCLEWGTAVGCGSGEVCALGNCALNCVNECTTSGQKRCNVAGTGLETCGEIDGDGCLEWSTAVPCANGSACTDGACALSCTNTCPTAGAKRCGTSGGVETCADGNGDGCTEWSAAVACGAGQTCNAGVCAVSCTSTCNTAGATQCNATSTGTEVCTVEGACLAWKAGTTCGPTAKCTAGACQDVAVPGALLINEALYDDSGSDTSAFVELKGAPGLDLTGFVLVGVNGTNGADYNSITLTGSVPNDGYFVVALATSTGEILAAADQLSSNADYQNGPDSIQLRWGKTLVDAVGYGVFTGATFAGEGQPAADAPAGSSIGRDSASKDTGDNKTDFFIFATPTPGASNGAANKLPTAAITCPASGKTGTAITVDASGSTDADGTITKFAFDWGDGYTTAGPVAAASHTYANPLSAVITVTVTDSSGGTASKSCNVAIGDALAPAVVVTNPGADLQVTQGTVVSTITVDVTPSPGRSITSVQMLIDNAPVGSPDTVAPYTFSYTVPANALTGGSLALQAKATDNQGGVGYSPARLLLVRNDKPVASMSAIITGNLQVTVDASGCTDTETPAGSLEVRWDWDNDGTYDTPFSTTKSVQHTYVTDGQHIIGMQVRDGVGQTASTTRTVNFQSVLDVSGTVTTTLWYGTINITGDVTVPAGETLTVAPGTTVVFLEFDQDNNKVGDFDLFVNGTLKVNGTPEEPVTITTLDTNGQQNASSWGVLRLSGSGNTLSNVTIEYGDVALDVKGSTTLTNVETRKSRIGLNLASSGITGTDVNVHDNTSDGITAAAATFTFTGLKAQNNGGRGVSVVNGGVSQISNCVVTGNASHGFEFDTSQVGVERCKVETNHGVGVSYRGAAKGLFTTSSIRGNDLEGVRAYWTSSGNPIPTVNWNNILENGAVGSMGPTVMSPTLTASSTYSGTSNANTNTWSAPNGGNVLLVEADFSEGGSSVSGAVTGSGGSPILKALDGTTSRQWFDLLASTATSVRGTVYDSYQYDSGTINVYGAVSSKALTGKQVTSYLLSSASGALDVRHNFFGTWPKVLDVVTYNGASTIKLGGFVGVAFDDNFTAGPYWGELTLTAPTTWSSDVYVTGDVQIGAAGTLTIDPGVKVIFVPTDTDGDALGDWELYRNGGTLNANGTAAQPIEFSALQAVAADVPAKGGYTGLTGGAGTASFTYTTFLHAGSAVVASAGTTNLTDVTIDSPRLDGVVLTSSAALNATRTTITGGLLDGLDATTTGKIALDYVTSTDNGAFGLRLLGCSNAANQVKNSTITYNPEAGVYVGTSVLALTQSNLKFNGFGVIAAGSTSGATTLCNIQSNDREGILVGLAGNSNPSMSFTSNNVYGNTQKQAVTRTTVSLSASSTYSGTSNADTATHSAPSGGQVLFVEASFSEGGSSVSGAVIGNGSTILKALDGTSSATWYDAGFPGPSSIRGRVYDSYQYDSGSISITGVVQLGAASPAAEMAAMRTGASKVVATGNYWGVTVPTASQVVELMTATIDYTAFKTTPVAATGPQ